MDEMKKQIRIFVPFSLTKEVTKRSLDVRALFHKYLQTEPPGGDGETITLFYVSIPINQLEKLPTQKKLEFGFRLWLERYLREVKQ